jgi:hypothetical protein
VDEVSFVAAELYASSILCSMLMTLHCQCLMCLQEGSVDEVRFVAAELHCPLRFLLTAFCLILFDAAYAMP